MPEIPRMLLLVNVRNCITGDAALLVAVKGPSLRRTFILLLTASSASL